jgi:hypothetical protein
MQFLDGLAGGTANAPLGGSPDLICLSHLRWDFVYQRPQHLMSRFAADRRVFYVEEPLYDSDTPRLDVSPRSSGTLAGGRAGVLVAVPHLPPGTPPAEAEDLQAGLLRQLLADHGVSLYVLWHYTPMAVTLTAGLDPVAVVYDCMDELSLFRGAPPELIGRERQLLARADLVFTGGQSLYEAKRDDHHSVHAFPSSIDAAHFKRARAPLPEPAEQAGLPGPRLGYFGVIDERMDLDLIAGMADARPDWQLILLGPVVKIDPDTLPRRPNLHYPGMKSYDELPAWLAGWDVALMPFALNESTRFISPTKTPEYLAGGRTVVSTPIRDVVRPYGDLGLVEIAEDAAGFVAAAERLLALSAEERAGWQRNVDDLLARSSWNDTWRRMSELIEESVNTRTAGSGWKGVASHV